MLKQILFFVFLTIPAFHCFSQSVAEWHTMGWMDFRKMIYFDEGKIGLLFETSFDSTLLDNTTFCYQNPIISDSDHAYFAKINYNENSVLIQQISKDSMSTSGGIDLMDGIAKHNEDFIMAYAYSSDTLLLNGNVFMTFPKPIRALNLTTFSNTGQVVNNRNFPGSRIQDVKVKSLPNDKIALTGEFGLDSIVLDDYHLHCFGCHEHDSDIFLAVLDQMGHVLQAKRIGGYYWDLVQDIETDTMGNIYIIGSTYSPYVAIDSLNFPSLAGSFASSDGIVSKFDETLNLIWYKRLWRASETMRSIEQDKEGNIYMAATFSGMYAAFESDTIWGGYPGYAKIALLKIKPDGSLLWSKVFASNTSYPWPSNIVVDEANNVWLALNYENGIIRFDSIIIDAGNRYDNTQIQINPEGRILQYFTGQNAYTQQMIALPDNHLLVTGAYNQLTGLQYLNLDLPATSPINDYISFYCIIEYPTVQTNNPEATNILSLFPNPAISGGTVTVSAAPNAFEGSGTVQIIDCNGREFYSGEIKSGSQKSLQLPGKMPPGLYFVRFMTAAKRWVGKLMVAAR